MYKELKRSAHQQAQANSKSRSSSAQEIKKLKPTCIETDQAQSKSSRSSAQQIEEVNQTERSRHIKSSRSSAQQMTEVKRTANGKGQTQIKYVKANSKSMISSAHQIEQLRLRKMHQIAKIPNHITFLDKRTMPREAKHLRVSETHPIA